MNNERNGHVGTYFYLHNDLAVQKIRMTQEEYLQILFNDLGFDRAARNAWLSDKMGQEVRYLDDPVLTKRIKSMLIDELKQMKEDNG